MLHEPFNSIAPTPEPPPFEPTRTAMLIIDMQYVCASREHGLGHLAATRGDSDALSYRFDRIEEITPRISNLAQCCREIGVQVIHVKIATGLPDGRDASPSLRGLWCVEGSKEAEILDELKPWTGDLVIAKKSISAFNSTNIDQTLRNLGVHTLIATGVVTNGCVELTIRDAADRGYFGIVVDDCCGANSEELHLNAIDRLNAGLLRVSNSENVMALLNTVRSNGLVQR